MYITQIAIYKLRQYPLLLGMIYEAVAEYYKLPDLAMLQKSIKSEVQWPPTQPLQVYYLDSLMESNEKDVIQVRFSSTREGRDLISVFLSIGESQVQNMTFVFPGRSGRMAGSIVIAAIKSAASKLNLSTRDIEFEIQGFPEAGLVTYTREHSLSSFVWIEGLQRYLHIREDPTKLDDVRRGKRQL